MTAAGQKYQVVIDPESLTSHTRVLRLVAPGSRVLDLGCATGALAGALRERGCTVVGVENDPDAARLAREHCEDVVELDLDRDPLDAVKERGPFEVVIAADVLEHLTQPERLLRAIAPMLTHDGYLVTSIPNVAHGSVRLALLAGKFPYRETGLLDNTHLRFYTRESMVELLERGGFQVAYVEDQTHPAEAGEVLEGIVLDDLPAEARRAIQDDPDSEAYQFIAVSTPQEPGGLSAALARVVREHREAMEAAHDARVSTEQAADEREAAHSREVAELQSAVEELQGALAGQTAASDALNHQVLASARVHLIATIQARRDAERIESLETQLGQLNERVPVWLDLERRHHLARWELDQIHQSRLWRVATLYRRLIGNRLRRR